MCKWIVGMRLRGLRHMGLVDFGHRELGYTDCEMWNFGTTEYGLWRNDKRVVGVWTSGQWDAVLGAPACGTRNAVLRVPEHGVLGRTDCAEANFRTPATVQFASDDDV